jgi:hypothetical protein
MVTGVQPMSKGDPFAWARELAQHAHDRVAAGLPALPPSSTPQGPAPTPTVGVGHDRALFDGVTLDRPFEMVPTALTNLVERVTGERDERSGKSLTQLLLAGQQLVQAGLRVAAEGSGVVAAGSSVLSKVLPTIGIASGAMQVWKGWNELESHDGGPLALLGSRTARSGMLNILAGALLFIPGVGTALAGAATRIVAAANELDAFKFLDAPTRRVEEKGEAIAKRVYVLDETPTNPFDRTDRDGRVTAA